MDLKGALFFFLLLSSVQRSICQTPQLILPISHSYRITDFQLSPNKKFYISADDDGFAKVWDAKSNKILFRLDKNVKQIRFSHDSKYFVSTSSNNLDHNYLWETKKFSVIDSVKSDESITVSPISNIYLKSQNDTINFYSLPNRFCFLKIKGSIPVFNNDGTIVSYIKNKKQVFFDVLQKKDIYWFDRIFDHIYFTPDNKSFITFNGRVDFYNLKTGDWENVVENLFFTESYLVESPNKQLLLTVRNDGVFYDEKSGVYYNDSAVNVIDLTTRKVISSTSLFYSIMHYYAFSPDSKYLLWDNGNKLIRFDIYNSRISDTILLGNTYFDNFFELSPQGVYSFLKDNRIFLWRYPFDKKPALLKSDAEYISDAIFINNNQELLVGGSNYFKRINLNNANVTASSNAYDFISAIFLSYPSEKSVIEVGLIGGEKGLSYSGLDINSLKLIDYQISKDTFLLQEDKSESIKFFKVGNKIYLASDTSTHVIISEKIEYNFSTAINLDYQYFLLLNQNSLIFYDYKRKRKTNELPLVNSFELNGQNVLAKHSSGTSVINLSNPGKIMPLKGESFFYSTEGKFIIAEQQIFVQKTVRKQFSFLNTGSGKKVILTLKRESNFFDFFNNNTVAINDVNESMLIDLTTGRVIKKIPGKLLKRIGNWNRVLIEQGNDSNYYMWDCIRNVLLYKLSGISGIDTSETDSMFIIATNVRKESLTTSIYNTSNGKLLAELEGYNIRFSTDKKHFVLFNDESTEIRYYETDNFHLIYRFIPINRLNYLVMDELGRYDGTPESRKLLYLTCGTEVVELDQLKDQIWVPNLVKRIMKGDSINAKTLSELNICGLTPEVEDKSTGGQFRYEIKPRRGGLGETVVYVNGIEARRYKPDQLKKQSEGYELILSKTELNSYFIAGQENPVTVKAFTADNAISSRGIEIIATDTTKTTEIPNLYAVMVGVSDYKDVELNLKYAAKDANDISAAVAASARKLLNTDGKEHVFVYDLTTTEKRYQLPEKNSIKKVLEEIGKKATSNDILLLFFAGHGVMATRAGEKQQFYFLTADASKTTAASAVADVGISTAELTEWMKPQNIKAQKRILIFDACNSGQAIRDFAKFGKDGQEYIASRNDEQSQQIKAIDKLNEQSGFFILSASASNQSAYEMGRYSQGLLTYSLLKAIKQQPDILADGKYLDVSRWFNAAEKTVTELTKENGARQQPQVISNTNFNIGIVDEEVMAKIVLPQEKPLFTNSNLQNADENIAYDDKELSKLLDAKLSDISARGADGPIVYTPNLKTEDVWILSGRYEVKGNTIIARINIRQGKTAPKYKFELSGTTDKLNELVTAIADKATSLVK